MLNLWIPGISKLSAIRAATLTNAQVLEDPNIGKIEVGKLADIVAVKEDPREKVETMLNPVFVMKGGKIFVHNP